MFRTYIGTQSGVYRLDSDRLACLGLKEDRFWAIHAFGNAEGRDTVLAGSYGEGIFLSTDGGATWAPANEGLTATALRTMTADPTQDGAIICGAEPARGFRSTDGGKSWQEMKAIAAIPSCPDWYLPYSPRAGAIRNFYSPPGRSNRLLGSIEVGGLLDSHDGGETWTLIETFDDDIHHITGHPENPDLLWLALGLAVAKNRVRPDRSLLAGVARSDDGGKTWTKKLIPNDYTRAVIVPPTRPDLVLAGPAQRVNQLGRIVVSADGGESWEPAGDGVEEPMPDMVELFVAAPDGSIWAICSEGRLLRAEPGEWHWQSVLNPAEAAGLHVESVSFVVM
ncbi:MAG: exo-alpha-sialidase [Candidatus Tectomicrobia bacterium]|nr:exo-alpha-sialidase [Candidatus Tectomicrobia bacterium]